MLYQSSAVDTSSVILSSRSIAALNFFSREIEGCSVADRLRRFCELTQVIEAVCLFENVYVDSDDRLMLDGMSDIFSHPKLALSDHPYLSLALADLKPEDDLDEHYGRGFVDQLVDDLAGEFPEDLTNHASLFRAIRGHDPHFATCLAASVSRDLLRSKELDSGLSRVFYKVCGDRVELPPGGTLPMMLEVKEFCDNRLWEARLDTLYLPCIDEYATFFGPESDEKRSLDAGRLVRRAYAVLVGSLRDSLDFEDGLATSESFVVPPITTAILAEMGARKQGGFATLIDEIHSWRQRFEGFRQLIGEFSQIRKERKAGYRRKLQKLRAQMERSSSALIKHLGGGARIKLEFLNFDKVADLEVGIDDLKLSNLVGAGVYWFSGKATLVDEVLRMTGAFSDRNFQ